MTSTLEPELLDHSSTIKLFPVLIYQSGNDNFVVVRWGGRSRIATRKVGIEAIRMFRQGKTLLEVRTAVAQRYGNAPGDINLLPLIQSLHQAHLIRRIGSHMIAFDRSEITGRTILRFLWRFYFAATIRNRIARHLPIALRRCLLATVNFWDMQKTFRSALANAAQNLALTFPHKSRREIKGLCRSYYYQLVQNIVDLDTLMTPPLRQLDRFVDNHMTSSGLEHVAEALAAKRGVILAGFHFSSNSYAPMYLIKKGYSLTAMGTPTLNWGLEGTVRRAALLTAELPGYGSLDIINSYGIEHISRIVKLLQSGGILLCLPDVYSISTDQDAATRARARYFDLVRSGFPSSKVKVPLLGITVSMTEWAGWLAALTQSHVLPFVVLRKKSSALHLEIQAPLAASLASTTQKSIRAETQAEINRQLFRVLEQYVAQYPTQWFGWHNLHKLGIEPQTRPNDVLAKTIEAFRDPSPGLRIGEQEL